MDQRERTDRIPTRLCNQLCQDFLVAIKIPKIYIFKCARGIFNYNDHCDKHLIKWSVPVSKEASRQRCPFLAFPECPGGLMTNRVTLPVPSSSSLSSLSA